jgi:hypothetical protein
VTVATYWSGSGIPRVKAVLCACPHHEQLHCLTRGIAQFLGIAEHMPYLLLHISLHFRCSARSPPPNSPSFNDLAPLCNLSWPTPWSIGRSSCSSPIRRACRRGAPPPPGPGVRAPRPLRQGENLLTVRDHCPFAFSCLGAPEISHSWGCRPGYSCAISASTPPTGDAIVRRSACSGTIPPMEAAAGRLRRFIL